MPQIYYRKSISFVVILTMLSLGILDVFVEWIPAENTPVNKISIILFLLLISIVVSTFWIYMKRTNQDFSLFLPKKPFFGQKNLIENPLRNPKRNFVMLFVVFFSFLGSGAIYSLILDRISIYEDAQLFRALGTILSGIVIYLIIKFSRPNKNNALMFYTVIIILITSILFYFNIALRSSILFQVTGYHAILVFLVLYIVETNIPRKNPEYTVYIWSWALVGDYFSISFTHFFVYNMRIPIEFVILFVLIILIIALIFIVIQFYESKLFDQSETLSITINNISEGILNINKENRIEYANNSALNILNLEKEKLLGKEFCEIYQNIKKSGCEDADPLQIARSTGKPYIIESENSFISGLKDARILEQSLFPLFDETDEYFGCVWVIKDITKKVQKTKEIHQKQRLDSLGKLAGTISHHFNNILAEILGNTELLKDEVSSLANKEIDELISNINHSIKRAKNIGFQLLTFSKSGTPVKRWGDINQLIVETASLLFSGTNIKVNFSFETQINDMFVDPDQITCLFQNLFLNSKEAMEDTGVISIDLSHTNVDNTNYSTIEIKDNGKGIDEKDIPMVFDPYFTTKSDANGLGLTVCYNIMKNHNGKIEIDSKLGHVTKFTQFFPILEEEKQRSKSSVVISESVIQGQGNPVLILDDEPMILKILTKMLEKLDYSAIPASNGVEAIDLVRSLKIQHKKIEFAILDINVPGEYNGIETLSRLRDIDPNLLAIASSGYSNDELFSKPEKYGFNVILPKPYTAKELKSAIGQILQLKRKL